MTNFVIKDLEMSKELDSKAMANVLGGALYLVWDKHMRTEGVGTFLTEKNELVQRFREVWQKIEVEDYVKREYDRPFIP